MLRKEKIKIEELAINYFNLMDSDEVFICNSVKGISIDWESRRK